MVLSMAVQMHYNQLLTTDFKLLLIQLATLLQLLPVCIVQAVEQLLLMAVLLQVPQLAISGTAKRQKPNWYYIKK